MSAVPYEWIMYSSTGIAFGIMLSAIILSIGIRNSDVVISLLGAFALIFSAYRFREKRRLGIKAD